MPESDKKLKINEKWADLQPLTSVIRVFDKESKYGDKYEYFITIRWDNSSEAEMLGVTLAPKPSQLRAIAKTLREAGCKYLYFVRYKNNEKVISTAYDDR